MLFVLQQCTVLILLWVQKCKSNVIIHNYEKYIDGVDQDNAENYDNLFSARGKRIDGLQLGKEDSLFLSKLSDRDIINLLSVQSQTSNIDLDRDSTHSKDSYYNDKNLNDRNNNLNLKDLFPNNNIKLQLSNNAESSSKKISYSSFDEKPVVFRLENTKIPEDSKSIRNYNVLKKIMILLNKRSLSYFDEVETDINVKELLFETLKSELKHLCNNNYDKNAREDKYSNDILQYSESLKRDENTKNSQSEQLFLVVNDDINDSDTNTELISVDPNSLHKNSSILLLGPTVTHLTDTELLPVMKEITNELAKPEYLPFLKMLSEGKFQKINTGSPTNIISGLHSRRYMKPHRCNHQSKLAKVYGGPKWIVCTGYLNINKISIYD